MDRKIIRNVAVIVALISVFSLTSFRVGQKSVEDKVKGTTNSQIDLSLMWKVRDKLKSSFLERDKMDDKKMGYGAIEGMVASLGDPYTVFLPPSENKASNEDLQGEFGGVGISLGYKDKNLAAMSILPKTPAEKAGLVAGDLILKIVDKANKVDRETSGIALTEAVDLIRGKVGTEVTLKIYREGKTGSFEVTLKRETIVVPSIELEFKEKNGKKVAWIKLYKFTERLYKEWPEIVEKVSLEKKKGSWGGVVLDVRNNPGGYLQASVFVASDFIKDGVIVKQQSFDGSVEEYEVEKGRGNLLGDKLVVLINGGSASAAEILAGALKDYDRGELIGEKSFGKGTVQQPEDFKDGSGIHITVAKWLLPSGKNIHKEGVEPDIEVKYEAPTQGSKADNQFEKALDFLTGK